MTLDIRANYKCPNCLSLEIYQLLSPDKTVFYCRDCGEETDEPIKVGESM